MMQKALLLSLLIMGIAGCSSKKDQPPLPGKRLPVLTLGDQSLTAENQAIMPALPAPTANLDWSQAHYNAAHVPGHLALPPHLKVRWKATPGSGKVLTPPLLGPRAVYMLGGNGVVYALDLRDGHTLWSTGVAQHPEQIGGGLARDGQGRLYVSTAERGVWALDEASGKVIWKATVSAPIRNAPVISGKKVLVLTLMNQIIALDKDTGRELWDHTGLVCDTHLLGGSAPAVQDQRVIAAYSSGEVVGLSLNNGDVLWSQVGCPLNSGDSTYQLTHIKAAPVIVGSVVYTLSYNDQLTCFDLISGHILWKKPIGGAQTPLVVGEVLFCVSNQNFLIALHRQDGRVLWLAKLPEGDVWSAPVMGGRYLYLAGSNGHLLVLDPQKKGATVMTYDLADAASLSPVIAQQKLCVLTELGTVILFASP